MAHRTGARALAVVRRAEQVQAVRAMGAAEAWLADDPALATTAVLEVLRMAPPAQHVARLAGDEMVCQDVQLHAGHILAAAHLADALARLEATLLDLAAERLAYADALLSGCAAAAAPEMWAALEQGPADLVLLFRRSGDVAEHVEEILAAKPRVVWMQQGIHDAAMAETLARAGIDVVQDKCAMIEHRNARH